MFFALDSNDAIGKHAPNPIHVKTFVERRRFLFAVPNPDLYDAWISRSSARHRNSRRKHIRSLSKPQFNTLEI